MILTSRRVRIAFGILIFALTLLVFIESSRMSRANPPLYRAHFAIPGFQSSALVILASQLKYFEDEGIQSSREFLLTGRDCLRLVTLGKADFAVVFETPVVHSVIAGNQLAVLTEVHRSDDNTAILVRRDRGVQTAEDLIGRKVATVPKTNAEFHLSLYLRSRLIREALIEISPMSVVDAVEAIVTGQVDAAALWEPYLSRALSANPSQFDKLRSSYYSEFSMLAALSENVDRQPEMMMAVMRALVRARNFYRDQTDTARKLVDRVLTEEGFFVSRRPWENMDIHLGLSATLHTEIVEQTQRYAKGNYEHGRPNMKPLLRSSFLKEVDPDGVTFE